MNRFQISSSPSGTYKTPDFHWIWAIFFGLLLQTQAVRAQFTNQAITLNSTAIDSTRGYWRLSTKAATRSTIVQFFGANKQLLYEEILPEKWVKLTQKNQKQFDQLLDQLLANKLLTARIDTESLPPTLVESPPFLQINTPDNSTVANSAYRVHAYINPNGKLYLIVNNPDHLRYAIKVIDQHNQSLYEEFTNLVQYRRRLDVSSLTQDSCKVIVRIDNKPYTYKIKIQDTKVTYNLQTAPIVNQQVSSEPSRTEAVPEVTLDL